jgi:hypothetical protein
MSASGFGSCIRWNGSSLIEAVGSWVVMAFMHRDDTAPQIRAAISKINART